MGCVAPNVDAGCDGCWPKIELLGCCVGVLPNPVVVALFEEPKMPAPELLPKRPADGAELLGWLPKTLVVDGCPNGVL